MTSRTADFIPIKRIFCERNVEVEIGDWFDAKGWSDKDCGFYFCLEFFENAEQESGADAVADQNAFFVKIIH